MNAELSGLPATDALTGFTIGVDFAHLPGRLTDTLRACFLDFLGVASYASIAADGSAELRAAVQTLNPEGGTHTAIANKKKYAAQYAALLNGTYAHTLDFDDTNQTGLLHPGTVVIPAALAAAESVDADGRDFLTALAVGYEVACRIGAGLGKTIYDRGFHPTAIAGLFGATAAAAKLMNMDGSTLTNAFGFCGSMAAGSMQFLESGSLNKRLHAGLAAHNALVALALAQSGLRGSAKAIEGEQGLLKNYSNEPIPENVTKDLGETWYASETAIKPYPSCRLTHAVIDAMFALRKSARSGTDAPHIHISLSPQAFHIVGERADHKLRPRSLVDAQFSVYFQAAIAWTQGRADWESYRLIGDSKIEAFADTIFVQSDPGLALNSAIVRVENGAPPMRIDYPLGEPENPLTWGHIETKFVSLAEHAYDQSTLDEIASSVRRLGYMRSMKTFARLLQVGS